MLNPNKDGVIVMYLNLIRDAHERIITNRDIDYRKEQNRRIEEWTELATQRYESILGGSNE